MATFTQDEQPYGSIVRRVFKVDGICYAIRRMDRQDNGKYEWALWRYPLGYNGAAVKDAKVYLDSNDTIVDAYNRLVR